MTTMNDTSICLDSTKYLGINKKYFFLIASLTYTKPHMMMIIETLLGSLVGSRPSHMQLNH